MRAAPTTSTTSARTLAGHAWARTEVDLRALRPAGVAMLLIGAALPHLRGHPGLPCPLRTLTGVPCPFCGCTTAVESVMHGDLRTALAASPLGVGIAVFAAVLLVLPRWRSAHPPLWLLAGLVSLSWVFELARFGFL
ncbi:MAG: DUF2752 domain-containing protein [Acidimicrobiales bacterium]